MVYSIRAATLQDLPAIDTLSNEVLREYGLPTGSGVAEYDPAYFDPLGAVTQGRGRFWAAECAGDLIGSAAIVPRSDSVCLMKTFYVKRAYRNQGIGYRLLADCERFAQACGYAAIELYTSRRFHHAIRLYTRHGYAFVEALENLWDDSIYRKQLSALPCSLTDTFS